MALSGIIGGLALMPTASAATIAPAHLASSHAATVVPDVGDCYTFGDLESYAEAYCSLPPGQFQVWILCNFGDNFRTINGPWRDAGGGTTSYARCPDNWFYNASGWNTQG